MDEDIKKTLKVLMEGGIILYPTDTIWGIGCDATNTVAVERIYKLKQRSDNKSMLVLLDNENRLPQYVKEVPEIAWQLIDVADKPLTIIYPGAKNLAPNLIAENGSIGIRIVKDSFCIKLIGRFRKPIVSTSANISGQNSPANYTEIAEEIRRGVDYSVKWRQDEMHPYQASSIIEIGPGGEFKIIRK
jgi:L-threonylcarbamoyladenylate synthase